MQNLIFDNRFINELPGDPNKSPQRRQVYNACWSHTHPTPVAAPRLITHSPEVAELLELAQEEIATPTFANVFAGNQLLQGMQPYAACYGGHQFGQWAGQLGDGRAITLGEVVNRAGERWELQLKGAGPTPYSRQADGRAVLRSSLREFLCSEAMHHLGVPTTRALSLVATGETVIRDMFYDGNARPEPGAIVCRVAPSFIRFGNFEIFTSRGQHDLLECLVDFTIDRDFPHLVGDPAERRAEWFEEVCVRTAQMVAHWMRVGFVHGVMNTDNMSILGLTIDYGPYGWIDNLDMNWTPNTTDAHGRRYRFGTQPKVAQWNLVCLANAIAPVFPSQDSLQAGLTRFVEVYNTESHAMTAAKFGFDTYRDSDSKIVDEAYRLMQELEIDMTIFFRNLAKIDLEEPKLDPLDDAFYREDMRMRHEAVLTDWLKNYAARLRDDDQTSDQRRIRMNAANPRYVLRNYLAQQAIELAEQNDTTLIQILLEVLRRPYDEQPEHAKLAQKRPDWARHRAGCSMLSCSS
ncbi:MAG: YdiU family protein [Chloroflexota bacterium]